MSAEPNNYEAAVFAQQLRKRGTKTFGGIYRVTETDIEEAFFAVYPEFRQHAQASTLFQRFHLKNFITKAEASGFEIVGP